MKADSRSISIVLFGRGRFFFPPVAKMPPDIKRDSDNDKRDNQGVEGADGRAYFFPVLPQLITAIGQARTPDKRADESVNNEFKDIHFSDTGRETNIGTHYREHAGDQHRPGAAAGKPPVGKVEVVAGDQIYLPYLRINDRPANIPI